MPKRLKAIFFTVLALAASRSFGSIDTVDGIDWWFEVLNGSAVIKSTMSTQTSAIDPNTAGAITVPSILGGYPVTTIGPNAFYRCTKLTSVSVPAGVTRIDNSAFCYCSSLESVSLPNGVTSLGDSAFSSCGKLRECELPASVRTIGNSAFYACSSMSNVVFSGRIESIGSEAFRACSAVAEVSYLKTVGVIGSYAFRDCSSLTNVVFEEKVESVGNSAFSGCGALQSVAFRGDVGTIGSSAFSSCGALQSVTFHSDIGTIGSSAFYYCGALKTVLIEGSINSLGASAFFRCTMLNDVEFEKDVGSIGTTAFYGCTSLTNVHFGAGLGSMADYVFGNCEALPEIVLPQGVTNLDEGVFYNCRAFTSISFPESISVIPDNALAGCTNLTNVTFTESVNAVGIGAFLNCSMLMDFTLPRNLERIEKRAFEGTAFWQKQADGVVEKDGYFLDIKGPCPSRIEITAGTKTIVANMFRDCTNLVEVVLPREIVSIGDYAFYNTGLRSVTFPSGLESIGERAFAESKDLVRVMNASGFKCGEGAFEHTGLATVAVGFDANKGILPASETNKSFAVGVPYGVMPVPTRSSSYNYQFAGWYTAAKGGALVAETNIVFDTLKMLYAHWQTDYPFTYYVRFYQDSEATSSSASQTLTNGVVHILRKNDFCSKPGYLFAGWTTVKGGSVVYSDGARIAESLTTEAGDPVPLYACWVDNAYDVMDSGRDFGTVSSFPVCWTGRLDWKTLQSGDKLQVISFKVGSSRKTSILARGLEGSSIPTIEIWRKLSSATSTWERVCSVSSSAAASCDFTKDAQYQLRLTSSTLTKGSLVYSVSIGTAVNIYFDPDGGSGGGTRSYVANLPYGTLPTAAKSECDFEGWYTKGGALVKESATVSSSVTNLIAHWAMRHTYYVAFNANGGQGVMEQVARKYGEAFVLPANAFVRDRYRFDGWALTAGGSVKYADGAGVSNLVQQPGGKLELYAVWSRIRETHDFPIATGSITNDIGAVSVLSNSLVFTGTLTAATNRHYLVFTATDSDVCRLAVDPKTGLRRGAKLSYGSVLVTDLAKTSQELAFERGEKVCLVVECTLRDVESYEYEVSVGAVGRMVSYDLNDGVLVGTDKSRGTNFNFTVGTPVGYLPTPTNLEDEVFFLGWCDAATNLCDAAKLVPQDGLVLTAKWADPPPYEYSIRFDGNGAIGTMPDLTCRSDVEFSLPSNAFVWAGCGFKGWAKSRNGDVEYGDCAKIAMPLVKKRDCSTPVILYARWSGEDGVEIDWVDGIFWHYKVIGGGAEVCNSVNGQGVAAIDVETSGDITVPLELGGAPVIAVGSRSFSGCNSLTSIVLPTEIESIGDYAFENCTKLQRVNFMGFQPSANPNIYAGTSKDLWSKVRLVNKESWTTDGKMLPARWPVPQSVEAGDYANTRKIGWWTDAPKDDPEDALIFYYYDTTGKVEKKPAEEGLSEFPDHPRGCDFIGWFTKPYGGVQVTEENYKELGVTVVYAHWIQNREDHDDPQGWDDVVYDVKKAHVYDGYLMDGDTIVGTIQVNPAKGKSDRKSGEMNVNVTASVLLLGEGKKVSFKGVAVGVDGEGGCADLVCTKRSDEREMSVTFTPNGLEGNFDGYEIVGARNMFGEKTDWDKRTARAAIDDWGGTYAVVLESEGDSPLANGIVVLTVKVAAKGKCKVSGTLPDGTKVSVSSQLQILYADAEAGVTACELPVVVPLYPGKKGGFGFCIEFSPEMETGVEVVGLTEWLANPGKADEFTATLMPLGTGVGTVGSLMSPSVFMADTGALEIPDVFVDDSLLPGLESGVGVTPSGKKWILPKADKVKFNRETETYDVTTDFGNPSGLKLTFTASSGAFKGSFKVFTVTERGKSKTYTALVTGAVVDGVGYGTAVIKKACSMPVVIQPEE